MQTVTNPLPNPNIASNSSHPASVPLSVYRQLANELQAAQGKINQLGATNQQLVQENQLLRREINKVVESVESLQNLVSSSERENFSPQVAVDILRQNKKVATETSSNFVKTRTSDKKSVPNSNRPPTTPPTSKNRQPRTVPNYIPISETFYIEEEEVRYDYQHHPDAAELNGWRLLISIFLIIITAFGAGYLVVRPLLEIRSR
ncbi:hypothetical protein [Calothrix sp. PCC 6303]|uniref:hypothetical protein n=1 Tax=Calothrix sp. PCC 6303 TaxID=1170562 RepID=UPI0002A03D07|nr:hypothetical protein [Calothrix sp. PCC 6303]AFZ00627.1 hypothetical protein Cal6303_1584 [Calothrix sp. PCC 6303]